MPPPVLNVHYHISYTNKQLFSDKLTTDLKKLDLQADQIRKT